MIVYTDKNWEIYERNGNLRITLLDEHGFYKSSIELTPEIMGSKLVDLLKEFPEEVWEVKR